jgi:hypothetical protein
MGPNLESRIDARKFARIALISQALIDKLQIIEWYNHRTKRVVWRMTASSRDRVSKSRHRPQDATVRASIAQRLQAAAPEAAVPAGSTAGRPGHKVWQMPATAQQAPHPPADDSFAADDLRDRVAQRDLLKKSFRAIILPQHRIPHQKRIRGCCCRRWAIDARTVASCGRCRLLDTRSHDDHWTSAVILRQHTTPFRPMFVPFDDLELVYQSLRNSSRHIRANLRASMRRSPDWAPFNLET